MSEIDVRCLMLLFSQLAKSNTVLRSVEFIKYVAGGVVRREFGRLDRQKNPLSLKKGNLSHGNAADTYNLPTSLLRKLNRN